MCTSIVYLYIVKSSFISYTSPKSPGCVIAELRGIVKLILYYVERNSS